MRAALPQARERARVRRIVTQDAGEVAGGGREIAALHMKAREIAAKVVVLRQDVDGERLQCERVVAPTGASRVLGQHVERVRIVLAEREDVLRGRCGLPLRDPDIDTLHRGTEGWATAIYLAALSLQQRSDHAAFVASFSGTDLELGEFLAEDILARQSDACRAFLLDTSVLGQLSAPLCDALTGRGDARQMLDHPERANLLLFPLDGACARVAPDRTAFAYRDAAFATVISGSWRDAADDARNVAWVRRYHEALRPHSEEGGYVNFMSDDDAHRVAANYRQHLDRLRAIKRRYDPENLFRLNQNIAP